MTPMQELIQAAKFTAAKTEGPLVGRFALESAIARAENPEPCDWMREAAGEIASAVDDGTALAPNGEAQTLEMLAIIAKHAPK